MRLAWPIILLCAVMSTGCGTTKWSDTKRTATEQLLISDAMDRAVSRLDFRAVAGKTVYLDPTYVEDVLDAGYLISSLRQHMLACACKVKDRRDEADYIVEVRVGTVGTDRRELLFGIPATRIPEVIPITGVPSSIPEMPLAKKTEQRAVAKIAAFAYNRHSGRPVWQSGIVPIESTAKDIWVLGAGPFQQGNIYEGTKFAGQKIGIPLINLRDKARAKPGEVSVADQAFFTEPPEQLADGGRQSPRGSTAKAPPAAKKRPSGRSPGVIQAEHVAPVPPVPKPPAKPTPHTPAFPPAFPPGAGAFPLPPKLEL